MPAWLDISIFGVVQILMLIGLFGSVIPFFPGPFVMWLAGLGYGVVNGFNTAGIVLFSMMTLLMIFAGLADNLFMGVGARKGGASWGAILIALIAGVAGTVLLPPFGGIIAAPLSVLMLEYLRFRDWNKAWLALRGMTAGWGLSFLARFAIGLVIMILWWLWVWLR
jgi:uncharacterized protein YqgC (DUF456 family)